MCVRACVCVCVRRVRERRLWVVESVRQYVSGDNSALTKSINIYKQKRKKEEKEERKKGGGGGGGEEAVQGECSVHWTRFQNIDRKHESPACQLDVVVTCVAPTPCKGG